MGIEDRKKRERSRRRHQILVAARRIIKDRGYSTVTMSDIAAEAELSPGTLYLYFKSKDDLLLSISMQMFDYLNMRLSHLMTQTQYYTIDKRLASIFDSFIETYEYDPKIMLLTLQMQGSETFNKVSDQTLWQLRKRYHGALKTIIDIIKDGLSNETAVTQPDIIAKLMWSQFTGTILVNEAMAHLSLPSAKTLQNELRLWVVSFLDGLLSTSRFTRKPINAGTPSPSEIH